MKMHTRVDVIACASGVGAGRRGCEWAPNVLSTSHFIRELNLPLHWIAHLQNEDNVSQAAALPSIAHICDQLAAFTAHSVSDKNGFLVLGGDQSISVGTWSGVAAGLAQANKELGLIWIDAHMDSHTPETSESQNIHGMPLAALMGYGHPLLTGCFTHEVKLKPTNVCLIGIRSYEQGEAELLKRLGVKIYFIEEVQTRGIDVVLQEATDYVIKNAGTLGIAIDVDGMDPSDAPGVGTPASPGIDAASFLPALRSCCQNPKFIGAEIVEFNPTLDQDAKTEALVAAIINALFQGQIIQAGIAK